MIRLMLRMIFALALAFSLAVGAIVAQPHDDAAMHAFFAPHGCAAPCFIGIHPGTTTVTEAIAILQAHPWVKGINTSESESPAHDQTNSNIYWVWTDQPPAFVSDPATFSLSYLHIRDGIVQYIRLQTRIAYGDAWLSIGAPTREAVSVTYSGLATQTAIYPDGRLAFDVQIACPITPIALWNAPIALTYSDGSLSAYTQPDFDLDHTLYHSTCPS